LSWACRTPAPKDRPDNAAVAVATIPDAGGEAGARPYSPEPTDAPASTALESPDAGDAGDLAVEAVSSFQDVDWSCDEAVVERRIAGSTWRLWKVDDLPVPTRRDANRAPEVLEGEDGKKACAFLDGAHAWVAVLTGSWPDRHVVVLRTEDGGKRWSVAGLGHDHYTDWPLGPQARMTFRDALHGQLETLDPPQNHNWGLETRVAYVTRDGGAHWTLQRLTTQCHDPANQCRPPTH
jgi:hypothetical protein